MEAHGGMAPPQPVQIDVSAVVDITADRNLADRIASSVLAAANAKDPSYGQSTINVQQNGDRMRIMLWGTPKFITAMLECLGVMSDSAEGER
jgi:exoribonuclease II